MNTEQCMKLIIHKLWEKHAMYNRESFISSPPNVALLNRLVPNYRNVMHLTFLSEVQFIFLKKKNLLTDWEFSIRESIVPFGETIVVNNFIHNYLTTKYTEDYIYSIKKLTEDEIKNLETIPKDFQQHIDFIIHFYEFESHNELEKKITQSELFQNLYNKKNKFSFIPWFLRKERNKMITKEDMFSFFSKNLTF
jgi:hypothetical protein